MAAGIISPLLIIVVAVTALGSFTIPDYNLGFTVRVLRFGYIIAAAFLGFYGICLGLMVLLAHLVSLNSLGVPMLAPIAPKGRSSPRYHLARASFSDGQTSRSAWLQKCDSARITSQAWDP